MMDFLITQTYRLISDEITLLLDVYDHYLKHCNIVNSQRKTPSNGKMKMTMKGYSEALAALVRHEALDLPIPRRVKSADLFSELDDIDHDHKRDESFDFLLNFFIKFPLDELCTVINFNFLPYLRSLT